MSDQKKEKLEKMESEIDEVQDAVNELSDALDKYEAVQSKYRNLAEENDELMDRMRRISESEVRTAGKSDFLTKLIKLLIVLLLITGLALGVKALIGNKSQEHPAPDANTSSNAEQQYSDIEKSEPAPSGDIDEKGEYTTAADVAAFIHKYHKLPSNYVSDSEAKKMGWKKSECPAEYGIMIGGRKFQNREKLLPSGEYFECDVDYNGDRRGVNRLVFTKDGTVYHTEDHYESFEQLY